MITDAFPDQPRTAYLVAQCESGLKMVQSNHIQPYGREESFGIFQIHARAWDKVAQSMGLDYKNNVRDNIEMAKYIYQQSGWKAWTCYNDHVAIR